MGFFFHHLRGETKKVIIRLPLGSFRRFQLKSMNYSGTINELNKVGHKATLSVKAKAKNLRKLGQLIKEYRSCNCKYLKDKVTEIIGDDGRVYLDRISERMD